MSYKRTPLSMDSDS
ncbi:unnamed protein product, partial [Rotaria sp. Silwood1]